MPFELFPKEKRKRTLTSADKKRVASKQGYKCRNCGKTFGAVYHVDHIRRFGDGGSDKESNLQALCPNCHADKTEQERHLTKQKKIRENEHQDTGLFGGSNIFGSLPKPKKSTDILGGLPVFAPPTKKSKSSSKGSYDIFGGQQPNLFGSPKRKKKSKESFDFGW